MTELIDQQLKRLDHLQSIVQRVAGNSFLIKGWAVTLASAILGLTLSNPRQNTRLLSLYGTDAGVLGIGTRIIFL